MWNSSGQLYGSDYFRRAVVIFTLNLAWSGVCPHTFLRESTYRNGLFSNHSHCFSLSTTVTIHQPGRCLRTIQTCTPATLPGRHRALCAQAAVPDAVSAGSCLHLGEPTAGGSSLQIICSTEGRHYLLLLGSWSTHCSPHALISDQRFGQSDSYSCNSYYLAVGLQRGMRYYSNHPPLRCQL